MGSSVSSVCEFYDVGKSTVYDLIKKKDEYYEAYANSDCKHKLKFRKTLHKPRINTIPQDKLQIMGQQIMVDIFIFLYHIQQY